MLVEDNGTSMSDRLTLYADEIAVVQEPVDISGYQIFSCAAFAELLKLAVNMGRQIICCHTDQQADFCVKTKLHGHCDATKPRQRRPNHRRTGTIKRV